MNTFLFIIKLILFPSILAISQTAGGPSKFLGMDMRDAHIIKTKEGFIMAIIFNQNNNGTSERVHRFYKINESGEILDSFSLINANRRYSGLPFIDESGKIYYLGSYFLTDKFYSHRYVAIEFDSNLNIIKEIEFPIFDFQRAFGTYRSLGKLGTYGYSCDFTIKKDTFYTAGEYLVIDSPLVILGREHRYFKGTLDGQVLADHALTNVNAFAFFFRDNQLYVLGYIGENYSEQMSDVGWFDHNGQFIKGFRFNPVGPTLCNGGAIDNRLYFSYIGYQNIPGGCPSPTVAIDVRDLNFNLIRRFRVNECGYNYCGNMPFTKGMDGSIYFQAVHESYEKFLVQKYTPDLQLIWSKEFKGHSDTLFVAPMQIVPTEDGGVLIKCFHLFGDSKVSLYKISADGDAVRVIEFNTGTPEPSVLSPNPCRDVVRYTGTYDRPLMALVHSADGRTVRTLTLHNATLDVATLPPGLYSVLLLDAERPEQVLHRQKLLKVGN